MDVFLWLLIVETLGLLAFPFAYALLPVLKDRGYGFAKPLGLLMLAYPVWLLGSLHLSPGPRLMPTLMLAVLAVASTLLARRNWREMVAFLKRERVLVLTVEAVFLLAFGGWALLRAGVSAIGHTEQPMDFAFLNASMLASSFPPEDPWLAGNGISYYYFGYLTLGLPGVMAGISPSVVYNLALALLPAMAAAGTVSLVSTLAARAGASLKAAIPLGLAGVLMLSFLGNLEGVFEMLHAWGLGSNGFWESVGIKGLEAPANASSFFANDSWWWWRSTRVIDTVMAGVSLDPTIHEYPFFSSFLGDLHPHVMSVPFVLLLLAFSFNLLSDASPVSLPWLRRSWLSVGAMGLSLGALGFINAWDLPVFFAVMAGVIGLKAYGSLRVGWRWDSLLGAAALMAAFLMLAFVPFLPYYISAMSGQVKGIDAVATPGSRPFHFAVVWGVFLAALAPFLALHLARWREWALARWPMTVAITLALGPLVAWLAVALARGDTGYLSDRLWVALPLAVALAALLAGAIHSARRGEGLPLTFVLGGLAAGVALLMGPELFYVVDVFDTRMNTVFKLYYQAWTILAVATPVAIYYWARAVSQGGVWLRRAGMLWGALLGVLVLGALYLPIGMTVTVGNSASGPYTLDGVAFLRHQAPGEHAAIEWLRRNAEAGDGVLEAIGDDYTAYGRVASFTGLPTILNWAGHQRQWRGSYEPMEGRAEDVAAVYQTDDPAVAQEVLAHYGIRYVVLGPREREKYQVTSLDQLSPTLASAFSHEGVTIYEVQDSDA